jgi:hypothetical protein
LSWRRLLLGLAVCTLLFADGGTLVFTQQSGPYIITLFSAPEPVRVGVADLSVLVQQASDRSPVLDAQVNLELTHAGFEALKFTATHTAATNKLLYAADVPLSAEGAWHVALDVNGARASGTLEVHAAQPPVIAYWPYFALVPLAIALYVLNQYLKHRRARPPVRA